MDFVLLPPPLSAREGVRDIFFEKAPLGGDDKSVFPGDKSKNVYIHFWTANALFSNLNIINFSKSWKILREKKEKNWIEKALKSLYKYGRMYTWG